MRGRRACGSIALVAAFLGAPIMWSDAALADSSVIGVFVEPTTTLPPPPPPPPPPVVTTLPPPPPVPTTLPANPSPATTVAVRPVAQTSFATPEAEPTTVPRELAKPDVGDGLGIPDIPKLVTPVRDAVADKTLVGSVKVVADKTRQAVSEVIKGKPVAEALQEVLPEPAAAVVVPAVRTASTFSFPIALVAAVFAFLGIQRRIDSADPKLVAAPMAHDEDLVDFE